MPLETKPLIAVKIKYGQNLYLLSGSLVMTIVGIVLPDAVRVIHHGILLVDYARSDDPPEGYMLDIVGSF